MKLKAFIKKAVKAIMPYGVVVLYGRLNHPFKVAIKQKLGFFDGVLGAGRPAIKFFSQNKYRVEKMLSLFSDEESRDTYIKIVKYRQFFKRKDFPTCNAGNYFRNSFFAYGNNEVLIDCGAFTGDTIEEFLSMNTGYEKIVAFEPGPENYKTLESKFNEDKFMFNKDKFMLINAGVYSKDCELYFSGKAQMGIISETPKGTNDEISVKVRSIDGLNLKEKVTLIKMDIEGGEMDALIGAKETILRDKPKLAVCIYHSNEDMVRIAEWIHEIVPGYKLYVRHNVEYPHFSETVLYAQV